jgi:hypothetical protein
MRNHTTMRATALTVAIVLAAMLAFVVPALPAAAAPAQKTIVVGIRFSKKIIA